MAASDHLSGPQFYHVSPAANRDAIESQGLTRSDSRAGKYYLTSNPHGMLSDLSEGTTADFSHHDVWSVDTKGLRLHDDPESPGEWGAAYTKQRVGPERLRLHQPGS